MSARKRKQTKLLHVGKKFKVEVEHWGEKVEAKVKTVALLLKFKNHLRIF